MKTSTTDWEGIQLYAGIDLHKTRWVVTVRTRETTLRTFVAPPEKEKLVETFRKKWPSAKIFAVYEAGCFGYHLSDYMNSQGIETIIVAAHRVPIEKGNFVKTDKIDSRKLASELSKGSLESIYLRNPEELHQRNLIRKRTQFVKRKKQIILRLKSDLMFYNITLDFLVREYLSKKVIKKFRTFDFGDSFIKFTFDQYLDEYENIIESIKKIEIWLEEIFSSKKLRKNYELLKSVPGIGKLSASTILLEIGDINRFSSKEKFVSYLGLTPSEYSSGDKINRGSLTGMGHTYLRALIVECTWVAVKLDPVFQKKFYMLAEKKGKLKAIVAMARKLATRIHFVLKTSQPYVIGVVK